MARHSIPSAVDAVVKSDLRLYDTLKMGVVNYKALARHVKSRVESLANEKTTENAVSMALQRLGMKIRTGQKKLEGFVDIFAKSHLQMRDNIAVLYLKKTPDIPRMDKGFMVVIKGVESTTLLLDEEKLSKLKIPPENVEGQRKSLSAIILASPREIEDTPGVIAHLMNALGASGINVVEVTSSYNTTYLIVDEKDSLEAVQIIRSLIERSRKNR
ncbi:MAG: ACT domain-containing protein [Candidatus Altiarchaeota archaeon]|nr:ACT domain-containing protein [Candidatus Altiarchaeota archaeon]